jgi:hypothetical protein
MFFILTFVVTTKFPSFGDFAISQLTGVAQKAIL